jgi:hypothetical protein
MNDRLSASVSEVSEGGLLKEGFICWNDDFVGWRGTREICLYLDHTYASESID